MSTRAAITVLRPREEVERLWRTSDGARHVEGAGGSVTFVEAPGDRGTEIHVDLDRRARGGRVGEAVQKVRGTAPLAKVKDALRRFKQLIETGVVAQSDATPEGELAERKRKQRPAQPLDDGELEKAGV